MGIETKRLSATLGLCGALLCCGLAAAGPIYAEDTTGPTGTTEVTVQSSSENIKFSVPTVIPFSVSADGKLTGPSPKDAVITNKSAFSIHVTNFEVEATNGWTLQSSPSGSDKENTFNFAIGPKDHTVFATASKAGLERDPNWFMRYNAYSGSTIQLTTSGEVAHVTKDLSSANKIATITWTVAPGALPENTQ